VKATRRELLIGLGAMACAGCGSPSRATGGDAGSSQRDCSAASDGGAREYCLLSNVRVRVPAGVALKDGEAVLVNLDDNTAVILARDADGLYARSGICTHACCIVALCDDRACGALTPTPLACETTAIVRPDRQGGIVCPCHGSTFRLSDGGVIKGPARLPLPAYLAVVDGQDVWVDTGVSVDSSARA